MRFPYVQYEVDPSPAEPGVIEVFRPVIPIRLIGRASSRLVRGLLDTGADESVIPMEFADRIGVIEAAVPDGTVLSASGEMPVTYGTLIIELASGVEHYRWNAVVGIVDQPLREALLGNIGFLRYFDVTFFGERREVRLTRNAVALPQV